MAGNQSQLLARQHEAAIVNVSSGLGFVSKKSAPVYCATKAGLHLFSKSLR
ncbi:SDR family NAD(P)-dependent oxidoreductase [Paenibacillus algorifonticola]